MRFFLVFLSVFCALAMRTQAALAGPEPLPPVNGIHCQASEGVVLHMHAHLAIYAHGKPVGIPVGVGIHADEGCLYWIHTHTPNGLIHIESPVYRDFTLGDFFGVGGKPLNARTVGDVHVPPGQLRVYVQGHRFTGDPRSVQLALHSDVVIEAGPPYFTPKPFIDWAGN